MAVCVDIADQTMGGWMRQSEDPLSPPYKRLKIFEQTTRRCECSTGVLPGPAERAGNITNLVKVFTLVFRRSSLSSLAKSRSP